MTEEAHLREHFEKYGAVKEAVVVTERGTGKVRGFAFVEFSDAATAERVLEERERTKTKHVICGKEVSAVAFFDHLSHDWSPGASESVVFLFFLVFFFYDS